MTVTAEQLRRGRNLADEDAALSAESKQDVLFVDMTPPEAPITLYAMSDGEPVSMPPWIARMAIRKKYKGGGYMFTNDIAEAPVYVEGNVKCFLHKDSPERSSGALAEVGIAGIFCPSEKLASKYSRRIHAENRHGKRWAAYQEHIKDLREEGDRDMQRKQLESVLALAGRAAVVRLDCEACGWVNDKNTVQGLEMHKSRWCKEKSDEVTE